jgi:hypothetical protein
MTKLDSLKVAQTGHVDAAEISQTGNMQLASLKQKMGIVDTFRANRDESKQAGLAYRDVNSALIDAKKNIALTGIKVTHALIQTNLMASSLGAIGTSLVRLDMAATAVDQGLTNAALASNATHLHNRAANLEVITHLYGQGKISAAEADTVKSFADNDTAVDIQRSRARMDKSKDVVSDLHETALAGIAKTKTTLASI